MNILSKLYKFSNSWVGTIVIVLLLIFFVAQSFIIPSGSMKNSLLIGDFLFGKKFSYGIPIPTIPWLEIPILPDFNDNGHLIEGNKPKRGDIVIFRFPKDNKIHYVKRCVAKGGDEILFVNKGLYIHFLEGDKYIMDNFKNHKIVSLRGKLWVKNPYMKKFLGIQYNPENNEDSFKLMLRYLTFNKNYIDMSPVYEEKLKSPLYLIEDEVVNAMYKKVEDNKFYMIGDNRDNSNDSRFWGSVPYRLVVGQPWFIYFSWDKNKMKIRWERIGRLIGNLQYEKPVIY